MTAPDQAASLTYCTMVPTDQTYLYPTLSLAPPATEVFEPEVFEPEIDEIPATPAPAPPTITETPKVCVVSIPPRKNYSAFAGKRTSQQSADSAKTRTFRESADSAYDSPQSSLLPQSGPQKGEGFSEQHKKQSGSRSTLV